LKSMLNIYNENSLFWSNIKSSFFFFIIIFFFLFFIIVLKILILIINNKNKSKLNILIKIFIMKKNLNIQLEIG